MKLSKKSKTRDTFFGIGFNFHITDGHMSRPVSFLVLTAYCLVSFVGHAGDCPLRIVENGLCCGSHVLCEDQLLGLGTICHECDAGEKYLGTSCCDSTEHSQHPRECPGECPDDCAGCHLVNLFKAQVDVCLLPSIDSLYHYKERCSEITAVIPFDFTLRPNPRGPPSCGTCS